jgi:DHA3 family multidrug efflux protein-like MFS transporter
LEKPLKTIFLVNTITWVTCIIFPIQPSVILLVLGMFIWMLLMSFVEGSQQTILQKVVPLQRQGRVFGFAQSVESMAAPLITFFIGPITQAFFTPFMTS